MFQITPISVEKNGYESKYSITLFFLLLIQRFYDKEGFDSHRRYLWLDKLLEKSQIEELHR